MARKNTRDYHKVGCYAAGGLVKEFGNLTRYGERRAKEKQDEE